MANDDTKPATVPPISPGDVAVHDVTPEQARLISRLREQSFYYMQDGCVVVDANGLHVDVNPAFCAMTGFSESEIIGYGPEYSYWPSEERDNIAMYLAKALDGEFAEIELTFARKSGERFPVLANPFAIHNDKESDIVYAMTVKDITERFSIEAALRESERRYRGLFENSSEAILILENRQVIDCNKQALELFGLTSRDQLKFRSSPDFFPPKQPNGQDSISLALDKLKSAKAGQSQTFEWTHVKLDGETINTEVSLSSFSIGKKSLIQAVIRDVTQRKMLERSLRDSEVRYRGLFENAGDGIMILKDGQIIDCNDQAVKMSGRARHDILSNPTNEYLPPTQPNGQNSLEFFSEKVEAARSGIPQYFEWRDQRSDGLPIDIEVTLTTFILDNVTYTQSILRDITERKKLERDLSNSELRFRALFDVAGDAIVIMEEHKIIDCNERTTELYGYSRDHILSTPISDFFPPTQPGERNSREFFSEMIEASHSGNPQVFEWTGRNLDGKPLIAEITLTSVNLDNRSYTQSIVRDITHRKEIEAALLDLNKTLEERVLERTQQLEMATAELLQRSVQYRALAAKLSQAENEERKRIAQLLHDNHQQLLVAAKLNVEMLTNESYDAEINRTARHVLDILDQAIDITRSLTMELAPPILYGTGLVAAIKWLAGWMRENHQLEVDVSGSLPFIPISTDLSSILLRSVRELLFNVIKHSGETQACVNIALADQQLLLTVTDDGAGFDVAEYLNLADSFGLLSIQEQLTVLNGRMDVSSGPNRGTTVTLSLPVDPLFFPHSEILPVKDCSTTESTYKNSALPGPIRILVADDHEVARKALVQSLNMLREFEVVGEAVDGVDAVEKTRMWMPDVILMDVGMPRLTGIEATRAILSEFTGIKIVGLSMHGSEEMRPQMLAAGAACYLQKLSPAEDLFAAILAAAAEAR
jgi:PAS domain S-box-containing protein